MPGGVEWCVLSVPCRYSFCRILCASTRLQRHSPASQVEASHSVRVLRLRPMPPCPLRSCACSWRSLQSARSSLALLLVTNLNLNQT